MTLNVPQVSPHNIYRCDINHAMHYSATENTICNKNIAYKDCCVKVPYGSGIHVRYGNGMHVSNGTVRYGTDQYGTQ